MTVIGEVPRNSLVRAKEASCSQIQIVSSRRRSNRPRFRDRIHHEPCLLFSGLYCLASS